MAALRRVEMEDNLDARVAIGVIDAAEIGEHVEGHLRVVAQEAADGLPALRVDDRGVVAELRVRLQDRFAELRLEDLENALAHRSESLFSRSFTTPRSVPAGSS